MIVITGGAGFIGSALVWGLNAQGRDDLILVDELDEGQKWRNLVPLSYHDYYDKAEFLDLITGGGLPYDIEVCFHMGACSDTTEQDTHYLMENNYKYSQKLAGWCLEEGIRFIYASSAATYGDGNQGYSDSEENLDKLRPLNMYGYSKHLFDLWTKKAGHLDKFVGLKYFNVFGPNEYHKGDMRSMVLKGYHQIRKTGSLQLFKSYRDAYAHGEQQRDFIYIKDVVDLTLRFMDRDDIFGLFNIGTGRPRTWNALARALFSAMKTDPAIEYIEMPDHLRGNYQYFTKADTSKLESVGMGYDYTSLEAAVTEYVRKYLMDSPYLGSG